MELTFGEQHIKANTLIALTSFLSECSDHLYAIAEVIRNQDCKLWNTIMDNGGCGKIEEEKSCFVKKAMFVQEK